jgi:hypothetical protein
MSNHGRCWLLQERRFETDKKTSHEQKVKWERNNRAGLVSFSCRFGSGHCEVSLFSLRLAFRNEMLLRDDAPLAIARCAKLHFPIIVILFRRQTSTFVTQSENNDLRD